jgi:hypothetical protein
VAPVTQRKHADGHTPAPATTTPTSPSD